MSEEATHAEAMRLDITHLLHAIDRGYFGDNNCIKDSAFIASLRKYAKPVPARSATL